MSEPQDTGDGPAMPDGPGCHPFGAEPVPVSGIAGIPIAGGWVVIRRSWSGGVYHRHVVARVDRVTAKMVYANADYGRQFSRDDVIAMPDEAAARKLQARLESVRAEAVRRHAAAQDFFKRETARLYAQAMSAGTAETEGLGAKPASAVPNGDAPESQPTEDHSHGS